MAHIKVDYDTWGGVSRYADPDAEYDNDDTWSEHSINHVSVDKKYGDLNVPFEPEPGDVCFLVWLTYNTGDSFGNQDGQIEFIDLYQTKEAAEGAVASIEQHNKLYEMIERRQFGMTAEDKKNVKKLEKTFEPYSVSLTNDAGQQYKFHACWHGYFERLVDVRCEPVFVK